MTQTEIIDRIKQLKKEKNAIILAHYYTRPEVQDIADYLGDSLGLSQMAGTTEADIIVFCGVHFMAETASIISPNKKVLIPAEGAGCSLAEGVSGYDLREWKKANPDGLIVSYVNTTAEVKAYTDYCCTSSNALKIVQSLPKDKKILFVPDKNLGAYIQKVTGREMEIWNGDCCVHNKIDTQMVLDKLEEYPDADVLIHTICDALLGAANMRDIGYHFPDTAGEFKDIDSKILLKKTVELIATKGYSVGNIDATICAERPKLKSHIPAMQQTLAKVMGIDEDDISIKATTTERLGFTGREEGISAYATVLITKE